MPNIKRVSPSEAKHLLDQGYTYVDVRTAEEFEMGHPAGSLNVPLAVPGPGGSVMNPEFMAIIGKLFLKDAKLVMGCATGMRSLRAAEILMNAGYADVVDQRAGFAGARSPFGGPAEPGWVAAGLPTSRGPDEGSYEAVKRRASSTFTGP